MLHTECYENRNKRYCDILKKTEPGAEKKTIELISRIHTQHHPHYCITYLIGANEVLQHMYAKINQDVCASLKKIIWGHINTQIHLYRYLCHKFT